MISPPLELSIVIPAFNEEQRLPKSLERIGAYLKSRSLRAEVLVVDDGSTDATAKIVEASRSGLPELRLISNGRNRGKGFSVRRARGWARGFGGRQDGGVGRGIDDRGVCRTGSRRDAFAARTTQ